MSDEAQQPSSPPSSEFAVQSPLPQTPQPSPGSDERAAAAAPHVDHAASDFSAFAAVPTSSGEPTAEDVAGKTGPAVVAHVLAIFPGVIGTGAYAKLSTDHQPFVRHHITEALNFSITMFGAYVVTGLTIVGLLAWPLLWGIQIVLPIMAALAANRGKVCWYPATHRWVAGPFEPPGPVQDPAEGEGEQARASGLSSGRAGTGGSGHDQR